MLNDYHKHRPHLKNLLLKVKRQNPEMKDIDEMILSCLPTDRFCEELFNINMDYFLKNLITQHNTGKSYWQIDIETSSMLDDYWMCKR